MTSLGLLEGVTRSVRPLFEALAGSCAARFRVPDAPWLGTVEEFGVRGDFAFERTLPDDGLTVSAAI
jgi:hypothetical protein